MPPLVDPVGVVIAAPVCVGLRVEIAGLVGLVKEGRLKPPVGRGNEDILKLPNEGRENCARGTAALSAAKASGPDTEHFILALDCREGFGTSVKALCKA